MKHKCEGQCQIENRPMVTRKTATPPKGFAFASGLLINFRATDVNKTRRRASLQISGLLGNLVYFVLQYLWNFKYFGRFTEYRKKTKMNRKQSVGLLNLDTGSNMYSPVFV